MEFGLLLKSSTTHPVIVLKITDDIIQFSLGSYFIHMYIYVFLTDIYTVLDVSGLKEVST